MLRLNFQAPEPSPDTDIQINPEWFGNGEGITDASEPPKNNVNVDIPAPPATLSVTSIHTNEVESLCHKRKSSVSPPGNGKLTHKLPRKENDSMWPGDAERGQPGKNSEHKSRRSTGPHDVATETCINLQQLEIGHKAQRGASRSASTSRKLRKAVASGNYVVQAKRFETWKKKITNLDPNARFDRSNPQKVLHSRCSTWLLVKEPGDATRFKKHVEICQAKPVPQRGTLVGMGWLTMKKDVEIGDGVGRERDGGKREGNGFKTMPCRGVSEMDNPVIEQYLKRTGAGGGGGRSIHVISGARFRREFKGLTSGEKEEVQATQRAEWKWTNDHTNRRVHASNCQRFTSSDFLASSLCAECKDLLNLKQFTDAIQKPMPSDENLKFNNIRYLNPALVDLYKRSRGLRSIIEDSVSGVQQFLGSLYSRKIIRTQVLRHVSGQWKPF